MADKVGEAYVELRYKLDQLQRDLRVAQAAIQNQVQEVADDANERTTGMFDGVNAGLDRLQGSITSVMQVAVVAFSVQMVQAVYGYANAIAEAGDKTQLMRSRLAGITKDAGAFDMARESAMKLGVSVSSVAEVMQRFGMATQAMGRPTEDLQKLTEVVINLGRISGATQEEMTAGMLQLGQALASGRLGGDELRSVLESMPELARVLAEQLGVPIGKLRDMGSQGQLTADLVTNALLRAFDDVNRRAAELPETLEQAKNRMTNAWNDVLAGIDQTLHVSQALQAVWNTLAGTAEKVAVALGSASPESQRKVLQERVAALKAEREQAEGVLGGALGGGVKDALNVLMPPGLASIVTQSTRPLEAINAELEKTERMLAEVGRKPLELIRGAPGSTGEKPVKYEPPGPLTGDAAKAQDALIARIKSQADYEEQQRRESQQQLHESLNDYEDTERKKTAAAKAEAAKRQQEQEHLQARAKTLTQESMTDLEKYEAKVKEVDQLVGKKALTKEQGDTVKAGLKREFDEQQARKPENAAEKRVADMRSEVEELKRLQAAQDVSQEKYQEVVYQIAGERAARQLGREATEAERQAVAALTIEQEKLKDAMERSRKIQDLEQEIDASERLQKAKQEGAKAYYETAKAIAVEQEVRKLGVGATSDEIEKTRKLAAEKYDLANREQYDRTYDPTAGALDAMKELGDEAQQFGKMMGDAVKQGADTAAQALTQFVETGKLKIDDLARSIEHQLLQGAISQFVNLMLGAAGNALGSYLGATPASPTSAAATASATPGGASQHAKGGVRSGPGIQAFENTVVRAPTFFAFARGAQLGVMGEAGDEGILPLERTASGDLGVKATGIGGSGMQVNINNFGAPEQVQTSVRKAGDQEVLDVAFLSASRRHMNSGQLDKQFAGNFGARPKPMR